MNLFNFLFVIVRPCQVFSFSRILFEVELDPYRINANS